MSYSSVKSVIFDFADNHGSFDDMGIRAIDFYLSSSKISVASADITCYATSYETNCEPDNAFDTSLSKTGDFGNKEWRSEAYGGTGPTTNERIICVFDTAIEFDEIRVNNAHGQTGFVYPNHGVNNTEIYISTDTITSTVYGEAISNSTLIYDDAISIHSDVDEEDEEVLVTPVADGDIEATIPGITLSIYEPNNISVEIPALISEINAGATMAVDIPTLTLVASGASAFAGELSMTIPPILFSASTSASDTFDNFDMELPGLTLAIEKAGSISFEFPMLELESSGKTGKLSDFKATLPGLTMSAKSGSNVGMELPFLSLESEVSHSTYLVEVTGDFESSIPSLQARIIATTDDVINASIPMLTMAMVTQQSGDNDIGFSLPALMAIMEAGTITDDALRYVRGKVR